MKSKGIKYTRTEEEIKEYMKVPLEVKLAWLQEANKFTYKMLKGKRLKVLERLRRGELYDYVIRYSKKSIEQIPHRALF